MDGGGGVDEVSCDVADLAELVAVFVEAEVFGDCCCGGETCFSWVEVGERSGGG